MHEDDAAVALCGGEDRFDRRVMIDLPDRKDREDRREREPGALGRHATRRAERHGRGRRVARGVGRGAGAALERAGRDNITALVVEVLAPVAPSP